MAPWDDLSIARHGVRRPSVRLPQGNTGHTKGIVFLTASGSEAQGDRDEMRGSDRAVDPAALGNLVQEKTSERIRLNLGWCSYQR